MKPITSLPAIKRTLDSFYLVSGLKVNREKSLIIPIRLSPAEVSSLQVHSPYFWATGSWRYLGVRIPSHFSKIVSVNLQELNETVKALLKSWNDAVLAGLREFKWLK